MSNKPPFKRPKNQAGIASIVITILIAIVLSLIVLGFAKLSRREQRVTLDRQLSTQAFYAAESAVNDVLTFFKYDPTNPPSSSTLNDYATKCNGFYGDNHINNVLDSQENVEYTCLLVNTIPDQITLSDLGSSPFIFPLNPLNPKNNNAPAAMNQVTFTWEPAANVTPNLIGCPPSGNYKNLPPFPAGWSCVWPILKVDVAPTASSGFTRQSLDQGTMTAFFVPTAGGGSVGYVANGPAGPTAAPSLYQASCNTGTGQCSASITGFAPGGDLGNDQNFYIKAEMIDGSSQNFTACAFLAGGSSTCNSGNSNQANLAGAQVLIDATGKANDVLRRIQVRADISPEGTATTNGALGPIPDYAIQTQNSLCKRFEFSPSNLLVPDPATPGVPTDPSCDITMP